MIGRKLIALVPLMTAAVVSAQSVAPQYSATYSVHVFGSITGLPTSYGGLTFKAGDPNTILIGGKANATDGRFYEVPVTRGAGNHITGFTGGEGATIDPVTGDFLFSTFGATNRVIQVRGFAPPPPAATVAVTASPASPSCAGSAVTSMASPRSRARAACRRWSTPPSRASSPRAEAASTMPPAAR